MSIVLIDPVGVVLSIPPHLIPGLWRSHSRHGTNRWFTDIQKDTRIQSLYCRRIWLTYARKPGHFHYIRNIQNSFTNNPYSPASNPTLNHQNVNQHLHSENKSPSCRIDTHGCAPMHTYAPQWKLLYLWEILLTMFLTFCFQGSIVCYLKF